jgi:hypothetical protein
MLEKERLSWLDTIEPSLFQGPGGKMKQLSSMEKSQLQELTHRLIVLCKLPGGEIG